MCKIKMTKLQILVPTYNKGKFIEECLDSVLSQVTKYPFELIISDDCSTDNSLEIAERYAKINPDKIKILRNKENIGCLSNTIKCYEALSSPYFTVLDPDDYWSGPHVIERAIDFLESNSDVTVFSYNTLILEDGSFAPYVNNDSQNYNVFNMIGGHTSSTFFRNIALHDVIDMLKLKVGSTSERVYEGDSFRNILHLSKGKGWFQNEIGGVYRIYAEGIWSRLSCFEQNALNLKFFMEMSQFLGPGAEHLMTQAAGFGDIAVECLDQVQPNSVTPDFVKDYANSIQKCPDIEGGVDSIALFLPSRTLGGYEVLFAKLSEYLSDRLNFNVYFIDFEDGMSDSLVSSTRVMKISTSDFDGIEDIDEKFGLIYPATLSLELPEYLNKKAKHFIWYAHPMSIEWLAARNGVSIDLAAKFLELNSEKGSLSFMDWSCWVSAQEYGQFPRSITPVFSSKNGIMEAASERKIDFGSRLRVTWIGRLDDDKYPSLEMLMRDLSLLNFNELSITLNIIGSGNKEGDLRNLSSDLIFETNFLGKIDHDNLRRTVGDLSDIVVAMGISSVEAALLGIPTIVPVLPEEDMTMGRYHWLHESKGYSLGVYQSHINKSEISTFDLNDILYQLKKDERNEISGMCKEYAEAHHSIELSVSKILFSLRKSRRISFDCALISGGLEGDTDQQEVLQSYVGEGMPDLTQSSLILRLKKIFGRIFR